MTYSIVARCADTGELGVAVQSHFFSAGSVVPWAAAGVGAVATQATAEVAHGPNGIARLRAGASPEETLDRLFATDPGAAQRQVGIVDARGRAAAHTGDRCIAEAGHVVGDGFAAQANMMLSPGVPERMAEAFTGSRNPLWARLLDALDAAEELGGDIRGQQSAALVVARPEPRESPGSELLVDLRVEDHPDPLAELRRVASLAAAYRSVSEADELLVGGDVAGALALHEAACAAHPDNLEFAFWHGVVLAINGRDDEALAAIAEVFSNDDGERWRELLRRLPPTGTVDERVVRALLG